MRGGDERSGSLFSYVDLEARVGRGHPLRTIRGIVNEALAALSGEFSAMYSPMGRPSIPPEKLLRSMPHRDSGGQRLLQQPALMFAVNGLRRAASFWFGPGAGFQRRPRQEA